MLRASSEKVANSAVSIPQSAMWLVPLLISLAGLVYLPSVNYSFIWDDHALIVENRDLDAATPFQFFGQSFTHWWAKQGLIPHSYYRPLVMTSFWLDRKVWGPGPRGYHLTNILLNIIASVLVGLVLARLFPSFWPALLGGLAFALHPMHVESVAFVAGRTDVMMAMFTALAFLGLLRYRRRPTLASGALTAGAFALALLCKEAAILFPALAFLPGRRSQEPGGSKAKTWMLTLALLAVALLYLAVRALILRGSGPAWGETTLVQRVLLVINSFGRYVFISVVSFAHRLTHPDLVRFAAPGWPTLVAVAAGAGLAGLVLRYRGAGPGLGALWFLLFMVPACNFFPPGPSYLSERLVYLPSAGVVIIALAFAARVRRPALRRVLFGAGAVYCAAMLVNTLNWLPVWKGDQALHETMARQNPDDARTMGGLGRTRKEAGDKPGAIAAFRRAVELDPASADYRFDLGELLRASGDLAGAERELRQAAKLDPSSPEILNTLGNLLAETGKLKDAADAYRQVVRLSPQHVMAHNNLGVALQELGDAAGAEAEFRAALALDPEMALANNNLGEIVFRRGQLDSAQAMFRHTIRRQPDYGLAHYNLGLVLRAEGRPAEARQSFQQALKLMPGFTPAQEALRQ